MPVKHQNIFSHGIRVYPRFVVSARSCSSCLVVVLNECVESRISKVLISGRYPLNYKAKVLGSNNVFLTDGQNKNRSCGGIRNGRYISFQHWCRSSSSEGI